MSSALRLGVVLLLLSVAVVCAENKESKDIITSNDHYNHEVKKEADKDTTTTSNNNNEVKKEADIDATTTTSNNNNEVKKEADIDATTTNNDNNEVKKEAGQETEEKRQAMFMGNPHFNQNYFSPWSFMNGMYPGYGYHHGLFSPFMNGMYPGYGYHHSLFSPFMNGMYPGYGYHHGLFSPYMNGMYLGYGYHHGLFSPFMNGMYPGYGYHHGLFSPLMNGMYPGFGYHHGLFSPFMNGMYPGFGYPNGLFSPFMSGMHAAFPRYLVPANGTYPWGFLPGGFAGAYPMYPYSPAYLANPMMYSGYPFAGGYTGYPTHGLFPGYPGYGYHHGLVSPFMNGMYPGYGYHHGLFSPFMNGMYPYSPAYLANPMMYSGYRFASGYPGYSMHGLFPGYPGYGYHRGLVSPFMNGMYPGYGYHHGLFSPFMNGMYPYSPAYLANPMMYSGYPFAGGYTGYPMHGMFPGYPGFGMYPWNGGMGLSAFHSPLWGMGSLFYPWSGYLGWNYPHWHQSNASKESPLLKAIYNLGGESTAPQRPSQEELKKLLCDHPWTRQMLFNNTDDEIVKALKEANSLDQLKTKLHLSDDKVANLRTVFKAVKEDNVKAVVKLGETEEHWQDFQKLLKAILDSGFKV